MYCSRFSSDGRSWATAIMIPKIQETNASSREAEDDEGEAQLAHPRLVGLLRLLGGGEGGDLLRPRRSRRGSRLPPSAFSRLRSSFSARRRLAIWRRFLRSRRSSAERPSPAESFSDPESMFKASCAGGCPSHPEAPAECRAWPFPTPDYGHRWASGRVGRPRAIPFEPGGESSIGPMTSRPAAGATEAAAAADQLLARSGRRAARGQARRAARRGPSAAAEAGRRPDQPGHPPRPLRRADQAARVPGRRPPVVLIIGDYTARVGDPSGRDATRPVLTAAEIEANALTYQEQAFKVLDRERTELRHNSEWLEMPSGELFDLVRRFTVARLLERDDFTKRMAAGAADLDARAALSGAPGLRLGRDRGRRRVRRHRPEVQPAVRPRRPGRLRDQPPQSILTMPILPGHRRQAEDEQVLRQLRRGHRSAGGDVREADEHPRLGDGRVLPAAARRAARPGPAPRSRPSASSPAGSPTASTARAPARRPRQRFDQVHVRRELPDEIPVAGFAADGETVHLPALIAAEFELSSSEARRLIGQGGVRLDGEVLDAADARPARRSGSTERCSRSASGATAGSSALSGVGGPSGRRADARRPCYIPASVRAAGA